MYSGPDTLPRNVRGLDEGRYFMGLLSPRSGAATAVMINVMWSSLASGRTQEEQRVREETPARKNRLWVSKEDAEKRLGWIKLFVSSSSKNEQSTHLTGGK